MFCDSSFICLLYFPSQDVFRNGVHVIRFVLIIMMYSVVTQGVTTIIVDAKLCFVVDSVLVEVSMAMACLT